MAQGWWWGQGCIIGGWWWPERNRNMRFSLLMWDLYGSTAPYTDIICGSFRGATGKMAHFAGGINPAGLSRGRRRGRRRIPSEFFGAIRLKHSNNTKEVLFYDKWGIFITRFLQA